MSKIRRLGIDTAGTTCREFRCFGVLGTVTLKSTDHTREEMNRASDRGWSALEKADFGLARSAYKEALESSVVLGDSMAQAVFLSYLAVAARGQGEFDESRRLLDEALSLAEAQQARQVIAHVCYLTAELEALSGDESSAISWLWRALDAASDSGDKDTAEVTLGKLGEIYRNRGWMEHASECFRQASEIAPESPNVVAWLGNLGQTLAEMQDLEGALECYRRALDEASRRGDLEAQSRCLASEGLAYFERQQLEEAADCLRRALEMARAIEDRRAEAAWLGNISNVFLRQGRLDEARSLCLQGLELARQLADRRIEAAHCDTLGDCSLMANAAEEALSYYDRAADCAQSVSDNLGRRVYVHNQGRALAALGRKEESFARLALAVELFEEQRSRIHSDALKTSFASAGQHIYKDMIELCIDTGRRVEAVEYVGRAKSRAMLDLLGNSPIDISELGETDDSSISRLIAKEIELRSQIASLERTFGQTAESDSSHRGVHLSVDDVPKLYKQWREVIDQLRRRHPSYASMVSVDTLSFSRLQELWSGSSSALSPSTAIVEFFWAEGFLFAAGMWRGLPVPQSHLVRGAELSALESDLLDFLEMSATEGWTVPLSLCRRLFDVLLAPVLMSLPSGIDRLLLVPHGPLHRLPFSALHTGSEYLIERYALSVVPSISLIGLLHQASSGASQDESKSYLISAISDYSATRQAGIAFSSRLRSSAGLEDLNYTLEEGKTVFRLASQVALNSKFLMNDEVKDGLLNHFRDYSVIHFAGHAVFNTEEPLASGLVLADGSVLTAARILADSTFRTDCGKLLVLSACETGVNVITSGGEMIGLARALIYAGMRNLISSLWAVADRSTANLMQDFHAIWQGGKEEIAGALREAQCKAIRQGQPVHAWAPFIHMGID